MQIFASDHVLLCTVRKVSSKSIAMTKACVVNRRTSELVGIVENLELVRWVTDRTLHNYREYVEW